ncbi:MAG: acyl carrier protein [Alphaproteobacteria bacterium]|nr:acyl carrier protein [Alphaproteobacteria bacterium]
MTDQDSNPAPANWPTLKNPEKLDQILDIIAEEGGIEREKITPDATLETLGLESMDVVMILMGIEDKLDAYLPMDTELSSARNLAELIGAIDKNMDSKPPTQEANPS